VTPTRGLAWGGKSGPAKAGLSGLVISAAYREFVPRSMIAFGIEPHGSTASKERVDDTLTGADCPGIGRVNFWSCYFASNPRLWSKLITRVIFHASAWFCHNMMNLASPTFPGSPG
jgi:hypothetical protein